MRIDCSITENYFKEKSRMTNMCNKSCSDCPLFYDNNKHKCNCSDLEKKYVKEVIKIVQKWSDEHPQKTYLDDFLEKYPNAKLYNGCPKCCPYDLGYDFECYWCDEESIVECWNRVMGE